MSNNIIQEFKEKGYVHLKDFLDEQSCKELTAKLKRLVAENKTSHDNQCPLSQGIHGAYDKLLEDLIPRFEQVVGLKLFPTYSYARLYDTQGEVLKNHRDRPACEISASITLDFEGDVWPIYLADKATRIDGVLKIGEYDSHDYIKNITEIKMSIGDAVVYRGYEKFHFREPYKEGKWQAQIFLHYVDQNGPYAEWKYDKRKSLNLNEAIDEELDDGYMLRGVLSEEFCNSLILEYSKPEVEKRLPYIGGEGRDYLDLDIRNVQRADLPLCTGVGAILTGVGLNVNNQYWKYHITHSNQAEFLIYDVNGKYEPHVDITHRAEDETRKLTVIAFLNDDFEGGKFYLQNKHKRAYPNQNKGTVIVFPSFMPHGVEPVTKGVRYSIVTWMVGPYFK